MDYGKVLLTTLLTVGLLLTAGLTGLSDKCTLDEHDTSDWITSNQFFLPDLPDESALSSFYYDPASVSPADRYVKVNGNEFEYRNGESVKFFGTNIIGGAAFMPNSEAEKTADRLAKLGFNLVAFHLINNSLTISSNSYELSSSRLDRLDYFINELKENGIYVILPLIEKYDFKEGDDVKDWQELNGGTGFHSNRRRRAIGIFNEQSDDSNYNGVVWLQKEYAKNLLDHRNPYTGNKYANEPAVLMIKTNNEVSMLNRWRTNRLNDNNESNSLTSYYSDLLDEKWNNWLEEKYGTQSNLESAWGADCTNANLGELGRPEYEENPYCDTKFKDLGKFYLHLQESYFGQMKSTVNSQTGDRPTTIPVSGMNNFYGMSDKLANYQGLPVVTQNVTWEHPPSWEDFNFLNTAMVNMNHSNGTCSYPKDGSCFGNWIETKNTLFRANLASNFSQSPFLVTEYSYHFPKEFVAEYPLIGASYGSFQDWNGLIIHAYKGGEPGSFGDEYIHSRFNLFNNPVVMSQMPIASKIFREGLVAESGNFYEISYDKEGTLDDFLDYGQWNTTDLYRYLSDKGVDYYSVLERGIQNTSDGTTTADALNPNNPFETDTGELNWDMAKGTVSVNTQRVEAAIGFLEGNEPFFESNLDTMTFDSNTDFASVSLSSVDGFSIANSGKLLLNATSRIMNTDMNVGASSEESCSCTLYDWGTEPLLMQPVRGTITLDIPSATDVKVYRLTGEGKIDQDHEIPVETNGSEFTFDIGKNSRNDDTLWYGIEVSRIEETAAKFRVDKEGNVYADGTFYGEDFTTTNADIAEIIKISEDVEPGEVVSLDKDSPGRYRKSREPYSNVAAGIISTKPGITLTGSGGQEENEAVLALMGRVPARVTTENGSIKPGDLLTTSSTPGHLMKCKDRDKCRGTVIVAKALESLEGESKTGKVKVLIVP